MSLTATIWCVRCGNLSPQPGTAPLLYRQLSFVCVFLEKVSFNTAEDTLLTLPCALALLQYKLEWTTGGRPNTARDWLPAWRCGFLRSTCRPGTLHETEGSARRESQPTVVPVRERRLRRIIYHHRVFSLHTSAATRPRIWSLTLQTASLHTISPAYFCPGRSQDLRVS